MIKKYSVLISRPSRDASFSIFSLSSDNYDEAMGEFEYRIAAKNKVYHVEMMEREASGVLFVRAACSIDNRPMRRLPTDEPMGDFYGDEMVFLSDEDFKKYVL